MRTKDLVKMAGGNLKRRKSRTMLTVLGIVIGTISILLMVALGLGMKESFAQQIEGLSSVNVIEVSKGDNTNSATRLAEKTENGMIQDLDLEFFEGLEGVEAVSPVLTTNVKMVSGKYEASIQVIGLEPELMDVLGYKASDGRLLTEEDTTQLFFGSSALDSFKEVTASNNKSTSSNDRSFAKMGMGGGMSRMPGMGGMAKPIEEEEENNVDVEVDRINMTLDTQYSPQGGASTTQYDVYRIEGVGILEEGDMTRDRYAYINIDTLNNMLEDYNNIKGSDTEDGFDKAYVKVENMDSAEEIINTLEAYDYEVSSMSTYLDTLQDTTNMLQVALGAIGAVALLVAAIGITNTMIMAIHERKKEIGVMKVIGATIKDIKRMFLLEASMLGFLGGVVGIGISVAISRIFSSSSFNMMAMGMRTKSSGSSGFTFSIPIWLIFVGMIFTTLVGLVSGYLPAKKAMKSSALEAIRTE